MGFCRMKIDHLHPNQTMVLIVVYAIGLAISLEFDRFQWDFLSWVIDDWISFRGFPGFPGVGGRFGSSSAANSILLATDDKHRRVDWLMEYHNKIRDKMPKFLE